MSAEPSELPTEGAETYEHVTIHRYTEAAADHDRTPDELVIAGGVERNGRHVHDDDKQDFVQIAETVAIIELNQARTDDEITEWCNSAVGKLALAHWFDHVDPDEVVMG